MLVNLDVILDVNCVNTAMIMVYVIGFDDICDLVYNNGRIDTDLNCASTQYGTVLLRCGAESGLTRAVFAFNGSHVSERTFHGTILQLEKQIEIVPVGTTSAAGDSGSLVFRVDTFQNRKELVCIGLAVGGTSHSSLVTPIKDVLEALDLDQSLKIFPVQPPAWRCVLL
jgi:hypothetical protein